MIRRCLGWEKVHSDARILGEVEPLDDKSYTDGMCGDCYAATNARFDKLEAAAKRGL